MNDIEYMLVKDAREKKAAGRGVYHKRSGSKTKYVGLPSDHMTAAELKRRNGKVKTYNISRLMTYTEFKSLPTDLASEYIRTLQSTYNVSITDLALALGAKRTAFDSYAKAHGILVGRYYRGQSKVDPRWPDFVAGKLNARGESLITCELEPEQEITESAAEETVPSEVAAEASAPPKKVAAHKLLLQSCGTPEQLLNLICAAFADMTESGKRYGLRFHLVDEDLEGCED